MSKLEMLLARTLVEPTFWQTLKGDHHCERCQRRVLDASAVWLECNTHTAQYYAVGTVPKRRSQGCFPFHVSCALRELIITESDHE